MSKMYFGYEYSIPAGVKRWGITTDPNHRLDEIRREVGSDARMHVMTTAMTLGEARKWLNLVEGPRSYYGPRRLRDRANPKPPAAEEEAADERNQPDPARFAGGRDMRPHVACARRAGRKTGGKPF